MTYQRVAYAEADPAVVMRTDCRVVRLGIRRYGVGARVVSGSSSTLESASHRTTTPEIRVSDDAARLATALHLHLD